MSSFSTPAIMLRRIDFQDYDLIVTFFTINKGKISAIAKSAKKSTKRFAGTLELFSLLNIVCSIGRAKGLPILQEATLKYAFPNIRSKIIKTAYASYWAELINQWTEEGQKQVQLFHLFRYVLRELDLGHTPEEVLSILFQVRFLTIAGLAPNLKYCNICQMEMGKIKEPRIKVDLSKGGIICDRCSSGVLQKIFLSKGAIKHLLWIQKGSLTSAARIRFGAQALIESLEFLEMFVPYHLGKEPRSLKFLRQIRK
jgi:DNA repair protein RecO (recombination protein O)